MTASDPIAAIGAAARDIDHQLHQLAQQNGTPGAQAIINRARASIGVLHATLADLDNYLRDGR